MKKIIAVAVIGVFLICWFGVVSACAQEYQCNLLNAWQAGKVKLYGVGGRLPDYVDPAKVGKGIQSYTLNNLHVCYRFSTSSIDPAFNVPGKPPDNFTRITGSIVKYSLSYESYPVPYYSDENSRNVIRIRISADRTDTGTVDGGIDRTWWFSKVYIIKCGALPASINNIPLKTFTPDEAINNTEFVPAIDFEKLLGTGGTYMCLEEMSGGAWYGRGGACMVYKTETYNYWPYYLYYFPLTLHSKAKTYGLGWDNPKNYVSKAQCKFDLLTGRTLESQYYNSNTSANAVVYSAAVGYSVPYAIGWVQWYDPATKKWASGPVPGAVPQS